MREVATDRAVNALPKARRRLNQATAPETPKVVGLLLKALEWQELLRSGRMRSQAGIARREGITRARVTQIMALLRLAPEIQDCILSPPTPAAGRRLVSVRCGLSPESRIQSGSSRDSAVYLQRQRRDSVGPSVRFRVRVAQPTSQDWSFRPTPTHVALRTHFVNRLEPHAILYALPI